MNNKMFMNIILLFLLRFCTKFTKLKN